MVVWGIRGNVLEHGPYGDPRHVGICEAWAAVHGLRDAGLRTLRFFVNCRRATDAHGDPPVQAYRNLAPVSERCVSTAMTTQKKLPPGYLAGDVV